MNRGSPVVSWTWHSHWRVIAGEETFSFPRSRESGNSWVRG